MRWNIYIKIILHTELFVCVNFELLSLLGVLDVIIAFLNIICFNKNHQRGDKIEHWSRVVIYLSQALNHKDSLQL